MNLQVDDGSLCEVYYSGLFQTFWDTGLYPVYAPTITRPALLAAQLQMLE
jgi:hypothetical protein